MADYIEKEKLRHAMYHEAFETDTDLQKWDSGCWIRYRLFENIVDALPAADVKPVVRGKWLTVENTMWCGGGYWKCSNCDQGFGFAAYFEADSWPFCPNCGADMQEAQP